VRVGAPIARGMVMYAMPSGATTMSEVRAGREA